MFQEKYTTTELVSKEAVLLQNPKYEAPKNVVLEKDKIIISSDAFSLNDSIQKLTDAINLLTNMMRSK